METIGIDSLYSKSKIIELRKEAILIPILELSFLGTESISEMSL
jgi:hypothetical protein